MSKTITVSDETYKIIKEQVKSENVKEKFEIKNRFTGDVIYTSEKTNCKDAIEEAVKNKANLRGARFYGKGGTTKIKKDQVNDFLTALGIVVSK